MRISICLVLVSFSVLCFSQEKQDSLKKKLEPYLSFSLNSNGMAPIPAFSLNKPAVIANIDLAKGKFSFDPGLAYGLQGKAWYIDSWLHYKIISRPKFELKLGLNFSTYCSGFSVGSEKIQMAERYFTFSITPMYKFSPVSSLSFDYWSDNGQEQKSLKGHFLDLVYDRAEIALGKKELLGINLMLFYINYSGKNDGLFFSPRVNLSLHNFPVALFLQATQAIQSNIIPWPGFNWNLGISYSL